MPVAAVSARSPVWTRSSRARCPTLGRWQYNFNSLPWNHLTTYRFHRRRWDPSATLESPQDGMCRCTSNHCSMRCGRDVAAWWSDLFPWKRGKGRVSWSSYHCFFLLCTRCLLSKKTSPRRQHSLFPLLSRISYTRIAIYGILKTVSQPSARYVDTFCPPCDLSRSSRWHLFGYSL